MTLCIGALDDDSGVLYTLEAMALSQGWKMVTTTEPETCLAWARGDEVDLLLLDYHMPKANGLDVLRKVRAVSPGIPVLILTVEERPEVARELLLNGADDFINKPVRLADFASRINLHRKLARTRRDLNWEENRKGISVETLRHVMGGLKKAGGAAPTEAVAEICGLAYVTVHRYLEHLVERGLAVRHSQVQDGRPGRPRTLYAPAWEEENKP
jgi:response regulator of citrate/malate metabolism